MKEYIVYVKTDESGRITAIDSSANISDTTGWIEIDRGEDWDKYARAQVSYLTKSLITNEGLLRYKLAAGQPVERTQAELDAEIAAMPPFSTTTGVAANAGAHNGIYRGKYLGPGVTAEQYAAIAAGTFEDLYIGDYWTIDGVDYRIAAFDYYYQTGDTICTTHHAVIVPDNSLYTHKMNDDNVTTGGYVGSKMYTEGLNQANTIITSAFGVAHLLTHRVLLTNVVTDHYASGGVWSDSTVELMAEQNVYGGKLLGNILCGTSLPYSHTVDKSQFPLFALRPEMIRCNQNYWLRDVVSATRFAYAGKSGAAYISPASTAAGVRPAFSIKS